MPLSFQNQERVVQEIFSLKTLSFIMIHQTLKDPPKYLTVCKVNINYQGQELENVFPPFLSRTVHCLQIKQVAKNNCCKCLTKVLSIFSQKLFKNIWCTCTT